jgi:hypothetical protein
VGGREGEVLVLLLSHRHLSKRTRVRDEIYSGEEVQGK